MKKILTLCMAVIAAMSMSAEIKNMTCAEAAAAAMLLPDGQPGTDSVAVTGYVTNTDGKISNSKDGIPQQNFYLDDEKGSKKTFQGYWCNMPDGENPLNIGDKVVIKGFLMKYKTTAEMKNGDVTILERAIVKIDTIKATVCEAVEECEALADGDNTQDVFIVEAVVTSVLEQNDNYNTQKFNVTCEDNGKDLQAYNVTMKDGYAAISDKVRLTGKLKKYGSTLELVGDGLVLEKGNVQIDTVEVNVAEALAAVKALENGKVSKEVYVITGYIDSISSAYSDQYKNISFYMCDDLKAPAYEFQAYRVKGGQDLKVGDKVAVTGNLQHYYKAAEEEKPEKHGYQTNAGATYEIINETANSNVFVEKEKSVKFVRDGQIYIRKNNVEYTILGTEVK